MAERPFKASITGEDWVREIRRARSNQNVLSSQIQMKLGKINDLPPPPSKEQATIAEVIEALEKVVECQKEIIATMSYPAIFSHAHLGDCWVKFHSANAQIEKLVFKVR